MISREEMINYIIECVDAVMPVLWEEEGLKVARGYSFMLDKDKRARVNITFENHT